MVWRNFRALAARLRRNRLMLHGGGMLMLTFVLAWMICYVVLPLLTGQGRQVSVPNLRGMPLSQAVERLEGFGLEAEVMTSNAFSAKHPPGVVLYHRPDAESQVKPGRTVRITLNAEAPPLVRMPYLIDGSVRNAYMLLGSQDLHVGTVAYVPDLATGAVLEQRYEGQPIEAGTCIPSGSVIDLVVGLGVSASRSRVQVPYLIGTRVEEATTTLHCTLLSVGTVAGRSAHASDPKMHSVVVAQHPAPQTWVREGDRVDLQLGWQNADAGSPEQP